MWVRPIGTYFTQALRLTRFAATTTKLRQPRSCWQRRCLDRAESGTSARSLAKCQALLQFRGQFAPLPATPGSGAVEVPHGTRALAACEFCELPLYVTSQLNISAKWP